MKNNENKKMNINANNAKQITAKNGEVLIKNTIDAKYLECLKIV